MPSFGPLVELHWHPWHSLEVCRWASTVVTPTTDAAAGVGDRATQRGARQASEGQAGRGGGRGAGRGRGGIHENSSSSGPRQQQLQTQWGRQCRRNHKDHQRRQTKKPTLRTAPTICSRTRNTDTTNPRSTTTPTTHQIISCQATPPHAKQHHTTHSRTQHPQAQGKAMQLNYNTPHITAQCNTTRHKASQHNATHQHTNTPQHRTHNTHHNTV